MNIEEICSIYYTISCVIKLVSVDSLLKLILKKKKFSKIFCEKAYKKHVTSVCMRVTVLFGKNIVKLLVLVRILLNANGSAIIKSVL